MAKIVRENLNLTVYSALKEMIANYRFKPGERINVEQITKELGVSRTPVWEAIRRLEHEKLVVSMRNKGIFMNTLTREEALDMFAVREVLEGMVARLAAERIDEQTVKKLEKSLEKQVRHVEKGDILLYTKEDFCFHTLIHEASGNVFLAEILRGIENKINPIGWHVDGFLPSFYEEHSNLIKALRNHDPEEAEAAFHRHNQHVMRVIRNGDLTYIRPEESAAASARERRIQLTDTNADSGARSPSSPLSWSGAAKDSLRQTRRRYDSARRGSS